MHKLQRTEPLHSGKNGQHDGDRSCSAARAPQTPFTSKEEKTTHKREKEREARDREKQGGEGSGPLENLDLKCHDNERARALCTPQQKT